MIIDKIKEANVFIKNNKYRINSEYRLNYHLMGEYGWINDPNGFVFYKGKYHLFYQNYPYKACVGPMHWGHAVSVDLIKWNYLPIALAPDRDFDKDGCFSGTSIIVDGNLCILYTGHICTGKSKEEYKQVQNYAYSEDGINFEKYSGNPVLDTNEIHGEASTKDIRDPKVFKLEKDYYMILGSIDNFGNGEVLLYKSLDLIKWEYVNVLAKGNSDMGKVWECPDIFNLDGKDILIVSPQYMKKEGLNYHNLHSSIYILGKLNTEKGEFIFKDYYPVDYGFDFYAPETIEDPKGRRIIVAWMDMWETEMPTSTQGHNWTGAMTLPREMFFNNGKLCFKPIEEIKDYRRNEFSLENILLKDEIELDAIGDSYEIVVTFKPIEASDFGIKLRVGNDEETILTYDTENNLFTFNRDKSGKGPKGKRSTEVYLTQNELELRIFVDKSSVEVFINHGQKTMTARIYPSALSNKIKLFSKGECKVVTFHKWDIKENEVHKKI
ncbi:glycoside hydrolase family 32 protein [Clostridium sp.]|uniref:glycoside hydrolase family 32 protein n=1 Tax=Clostridium sp. TaxID=1506 RepID=UPI001A619EE7|nr:glycoside hydrolase family 32 protein [Clostridium sp.]MBK5234711.1 glycoside hydrolase family 32 protein [Clostridium sp.]